MITKEIIHNGLKYGYISIENSFPNGCIGLCCRIADSAFYFTDLEDEHYSAEEYLSTRPLDEIVDRLYDILKDASSAEENGLDDGEYEYYEAVLDNAKEVVYDATVNKIEVRNASFDFGFSVDETIRLLMCEREIGRGGISETEKPSEIYLEWIELYPGFRGKHLLRPTLLAICEYFHVDTIICESSIDNVDIYKHLGAEETEYDEFREMQGFKLTADALRNQQQHTKIRSKNR